MGDAVPSLSRPDDRQDRSGAAWPSSIAFVVSGGLVIGALTSVGQSMLPDEVRSLANASSPWALAAFVLAATAGGRDALRSAMLAAAALLAMLASYDLVATLRGVPIGASMTVFWVAAAAIAGPVLGVGAAWSQGTEPWKAATGVAIIASILVGEGIYGLTVIGDTTSPVYWVAQLLVGLGFVALLSLRLRSWTGLVLSAALTAIGAAAFVVLYARVTGLA